MIYGLLVCCNLHFNPYPANELVLKMAVALYVSCIYSYALQTTFNHATIHFEPCFLCQLHLFKYTCNIGFLSI